MAVSPGCGAWAVGYYSDGAAYQTLVERWNGTTWTIAPSPNPGGPQTENKLLSVAASASGISWAVGDYNNGHAIRTLIERWDGTHWAVVPSPNAGTAAAANVLKSVVVVSARNAWAVGYSNAGSVDQTLVEHWNGDAWTIVPSRDPGGSSSYNDLVSVAATATGQAWAVGSYFDGTRYRTLIERWNGTAWRTAPSPNADPSAAGNDLKSVTVLSAANAWAVGDSSRGGTSRTLIEHWNGAVWKIVPSPSPGGTTSISYLDGVAATSAHEAWAVGDYNKGNGLRTLIEHWNGTAWHTIRSPNPGVGPVLNAVAASPAGGTWTVGFYGSPFRALAMHNGGAMFACAFWPVTSQPSSPGGTPEFAAVAVLSECNAWAAGPAVPGTQLIEHWNGTMWSVVPSPTKGTSSVIGGLAFVSSNSGWAVGGYYKGSYEGTLIERWDGTAWEIVPSPSPGGGPNGINILTAVTATSASDAWAVGYYVSNFVVGTIPAFRTLTEHWDGTAWKAVRSPNSSSHPDNELYSVTATAANDVWAVGTTGNYDENPVTLIEHWNGFSWQIVPSPNLFSFPVLTGVTAVSARDVWAVGFYYPLNLAETLIEHWNGTAWHIVKSADRPADNFLNGVVAISADDIWAVGEDAVNGVGETLVEHWDGTTWAIVSSPDPGNGNALDAVAAGPGNVWAVGWYGSNGAAYPLALHWG